MDRREFLARTGTAAVGTAAFVGEAAADHSQEGEENPTGGDGTRPYQSKIRTIRSPLAGVPTIEVVGDVLRVELDADATIDTATLSGSLVPSFGGVETPTDLKFRGVSDGTSAIWNADEDEDADVTVARFQIPEFTPQRGFTEGLYDLHISWAGGDDHQPRAVSVRESIPDQPKVAVIADPQIGDPRALGTGAQESFDERSADPFVTRTRRTTGDRPSDRWEATRRAIAEVNAIDPDLVVVAGDLTFGQDAPGKYYAEYEDAWDIVNEIRAPSYCTVGNHDGYVQSGVDGKALYRETFGPPSYSVEIGGLHLVSVDTYDWSYLDRTGASAAVSTFGGQVRDAQFDWLDSDLRNADGTVLAFGHHNPSWQPDPENRFREETQGTPAAEQTARGSRFPESGQLWTGENQFRLRQLFDETGVEAFFSGHSHRDRIARSVPAPAGVADIAETHGPRSSPAAYHYIEYGLREGETNDGDGEYGEYAWEVDPESRSAAEVVDRLRDTSLGTLYVNCTTTASSTGQYWGWRPLTVDLSNASVDPATFGYPWESEASLDERTVNEEAWTATHTDVGLYSHPSYLLSVDRVEETDDRAVVRVNNDLATSVEGSLLQTLDDCAGVRVENATTEWRRRGDGEQVLKLAYDVAEESELEITVECVSQEPNDDLQS
jgi:3',5'-cyclic AMP phosphodiesterase CpdA